MVFRYYNINLFYGLQLLDFYAVMDQYQLVEVVTNSLIYAR